ncbi:YtxH domain-containing protein [Neorhizobium lilium]|uniref:YtxH domain-containing protein n=1 Tax=Neorhizobium lilium TaxID=2503024 RepID=A0A444LKL5_9HYPH|nr:YtxH domain-containing protein [Neorhizobium lilium]RWX80850.1 YtxH domain-containing protein [Neorhizobium lilium]
MSYTTDNKSTAKIEREIEEDRRRIEERIDAIQQRMSPGQLVDEVVNYAKSSGGGEYVSNFSSALKNNPIPLALMGVSLAWLMAGPKTGSAYLHNNENDSSEHPLATVEGSIRRTGPIQSDGGSRYSHFADTAGQKFKALTDETGRRAGHFVDDSGRSFRGFADSTGQQVHDIRDEAGKLFDDASGWISKTWQQVTQQVSGSAGYLGDKASSAGRSSLDFGSQLNDGILKHFKDQPLIGGALAFAVGAAIGAALPHTTHEDEALGATADEIKKKLSDEAHKTMDKAENLATDVLDKAVAVASDVHDVARDRIAEEAESLQRPNTDTARAAGAAPGPGTGVPSNNGRPN